MANPLSRNPTTGGAPRHAVSRATGTAPGQGSDTEQSSEWLAELEVDAEPSPGVPLDTSSKRGSTAIESKRGSHKSG